MEQADVVVIGAGVIGSAIAYELSKAGARVLLLDRALPGGGASAANPGVVSLLSKKPGPALELALASARLFPQLGEELGVDLEFIRAGAMVIIQTEAEQAFMERLVEQQRAAGVPVQLLSAAEANRLHPFRPGSVLGAAYCADDANINPFKLTYGFARAAERLGARVLPNTAVERVLVEQDRARGVRTSRGQIRADWVVNAAGVDSPLIGQTVGAPHPVSPRRGQVMISEPIETTSRVRVSAARALAAKHLPRTPGQDADQLHAGLSLTWKPAGNLFIGNTNETTGPGRHLTAEGIRRVVRGIVEVLPGLASLRVVRAWAGARPNSELGQPILGRAGGPPGYLVATGHGGDGIALSPITAKYLAALIVGERDDLSLAEFLASQAPAMSVGVG